MELTSGVRAAPEADIALGSFPAPPGNPARLFVRSALRWVLGSMAIGLYLSLFLRTLWRIGDEGSIVYGAQRVTEGAVPYRDFFEVMGPGSFYWLALWFKVLGVSWTTSRAAIVATALGSAWAIYYVTS